MTNFESLKLLEFRKTVGFGNWITFETYLIQWTILKCDQKGRGYGKS